MLYLYEDGAEAFSKDPAIPPPGGESIVYPGAVLVDTVWNILSNSGSPDGSDPLMGHICVYLLAYHIIEQ